MTKFLKYCVALVLFALMADMAVGQTERSEVEYRSPYIDLRPVKCVQTCERQNGVLHGSYTLKGSDTFKGAKRTDVQQYSEFRTYSHGTLHGTFSQSYKHVGKGDVAGAYQVERIWSVKGSFEQGKPDGVWVFSVSSKVNAKGENSHTRYTEQVTYSHGELCRITDERGNCLDVNPDGTLTGSCTMKDNTLLVLSKSIVVGSYLNKEGDRLPVGPAQKALLDRAGSTFEMADHGYAIDYQEVFLQQSTRLADMIDRYTHLGSIAKDFPKMPYSVRVGLLREVDAVSPDRAFEYYFQSPGKADQMLKEGYYITRGTKRFFGTEAERRIRSHYTQTRSENLARKLDLIVKIMDSQPWDDVLQDCRNGKSPLLDLFAVRWSSPTLTREEQYREAAELIDRQFGPLYPLSGYRIQPLEYAPYRGLSAQVEMQRRGTDTVSYESFLVDISADPDGYILLSRMNPSDYRRVANDWDSIARFEARLQARCRQLMERLGSMRDYQSSYKFFFDSVFCDRTTIPEVRMEDLGYLDEVQEEVWENADLLKTIHQQHLLLQHHEQAERRERQSRTHKDSYLQHCRKEFPTVFWSRTSLDRFYQLQRKYISAYGIEFR